MMNFIANLFPKMRLYYYECLIEYVKDGRFFNGFLCLYNNECIESKKWTNFVCWKRMKEVKALRHSHHLREDARYNLNCDRSCFYAKTDRIAFLKDCIELLKKNNSIK